MVASSAGARIAPPSPRLPEPASKKTTRSAPAEKRPHGDDGWGEFVRSADPVADQISGKGARKIVPPHPSYPIMRRLGADLEEKREPRVAAAAGAQKGDGMRPSEPA